MAKFALNSFTCTVLVFYLSTLVLGQGTQFITGPCTSDADCASSCCGFKSGKCAGPVVAQERDGGCGFGNSSPNDNAAVALGFTGVGAPGTGSGTSSASGATSNDTSSSSGSSSSGSNNTNGSSTGGSSSSSSSSSSGSGGSGAGNGAGAQFITGPCNSDADCASACCGFNSGKCAGPVIAQERDGGCGFGDAQPNDIAAQAFRNNQRRWAAYDYRGE